MVRVWLGSGNYNIWLRLLKHCAGQKDYINLGLLQNANSSQKCYMHICHHVLHSLPFCLATKRIYCFIHGQCMVALNVYHEVWN